MKTNFFLCMILFILLSACQLIAPSQIPSATSTQINTFTPRPTLRPTFTPTVTFTPIPTITPTITPTPIGGGSGRILFSQAERLYSINTNGKDKILIDDNCMWHVEFSPDGHLMTCSRLYPGSDDFNFHTSGITLINLDTHKVIKRFAESVEVGHVQLSRPMINWSPDSNQIVFSGYENGKFGLYIINIKDGTVKKLTSPTDIPNIGFPKWSPDGSKIAFTELIDASSHYWNFNTYVINSDGKNLIKINKQGYGDIVWGKDSNTLFVGGHGLDLLTMQDTGETVNSFDNVSPDGNFVPIPIGKTVSLIALNPVKKIDLASKFPQLSMNQGKPVWSPDSKTLAFYVHYNNKSAIFLLSVDTLTGSYLVDVAHEGKYYYDDVDMVWTPDGKYIVFDQLDGNGGYGLYLVDLFGNVTKLSSDKYPVHIYLEPEKK